MVSIGVCIESWALETSKYLPLSRKLWLFSLPPLAAELSLSPMPPSPPVELSSLLAWLFGLSVV